MQGRLVEKPWSAITRSILQRRLMVYKASNRAAVHGSKLPAVTDTDLFNKDEMEKDIQKGKQEKEEEGVNRESCGRRIQPPKLTP